MIARQSPKNPAAIPAGRRTKITKQSPREEVTETSQGPAEESTETLPTKKARTPQQRAAMIAALKAT